MGLLAWYGVVSCVVCKVKQDTEVRAEERVAVLEYELRTARDTVSQLRGELAHRTANTRLQGITEEHELQEDPLGEEEEMKPYERKWLNFMVHGNVIMSGRCVRTV